MRARGDSWRWSPGETVARISSAVLKGAPTLTISPGTEDYPWPDIAEHLAPLVGVGAWGS